MKEKNLSKEDKEVYQKIVKYGTMEDMFDFAYVVGRAELAQEELNKLTMKRL